MDRALETKGPGGGWPGRATCCLGESRLEASLALRAGRAGQEGTLRDRWCLERPFHWPSHTRS